jgi:positive regulator of sigma E activity
MCLKQDLSTQQQQLYFKKLTQITEIPNKFKLTEEQLVQIAIEENILIGDSMYLYCVHILLFQITNIYLMSCILCYNIVYTFIETNFRSLQILLIQISMIYLRIYFFVIYQTHQRKDEYFFGLHS